MSWRHESKRVGAIVWKDFTAERRTKANFNAVVFLAVLTLLMFGFALGPDTQTLREVAGGVVWLTILFSGVLSFNRSYEQELEGGALDALLLYPSFLVLIELNGSPHPLGRAGWNRRLKRCELLCAQRFAGSFFVGRLLGRLRVNF